MKRPEQELDLPNHERLGLWEEALLCPACKATRLPGESAPICVCFKAVDWLLLSRWSQASSILSLRETIASDSSSAVSSEHPGQDQEEVLPLPRDF